MPDKDVHILREAIFVVYNFLKSFFLQMYITNNEAILRLSFILKWTLLFFRFWLQEFLKWFKETKEIKAVKDIFNTFQKEIFKTFQKKKTAVYPSLYMFPVNLLFLNQTRQCWDNETSQTFFFVSRDLVKGCSNKII